MTKITRTNSVSAIVDAEPTFGAGIGPWIAPRPSPSHLKRILGLGRLRLHGPRCAQFEFTMAAIAQNLRRLGLGGQPIVGWDQILPGLRQ